ncbi:MAG: hypothetical protein FWD64_04760 [Acidobacteriaceae bacterium]|nr:hypothetical protein [Acidobacteriaceae bacterium]
MLWTSLVLFLTPLAGASLHAQTAVQVNANNKRAIVLGHVIDATGVVPHADGNPANLIITATPNSRTVPAAGGSATYNVSVKSKTGSSDDFPDAFWLVAASVPLSQMDGVTVSDTGLAWNSDATEATTAFTITLPKVTASVRNYSPLAFALLLLPVMLIGKARKLRMSSLLLVMLAFGAITGVVGCGGSGNIGPPTPTPGQTPAGSTTYPIYFALLDESATTVLAKSDTVTLIQEGK